MKHFVLEGEYLVPFEELAELIRRIARSCRKATTPGISCAPARTFRPAAVIARAQTLEKLHEILAEEPFTKAGKMRFCRITEFNPVQHQPVLREWFGKA